MQIKFILWTAGKLILGNRGRAMIPLLGVATGISLVFVILSMGEGGRRTVNNDLSFLGENRIMVEPSGSRRAKGFGMTDMKMIERIPGVEYVHLTENRLEALTTRGNRVEVTGYSQRALNTMEVELLDGRGFPIERGKIIIDERTALEEFGRKDVANRRLTLQIGNRRMDYFIQGVYRNGLDNIRNRGQAMAPANEIGSIMRRVKSREIIVAFDEEEGLKAAYSMILSALDRAHGGRSLYRIKETNNRYQRIRKIMRIINISLGVMGIAALILGGVGAANMIQLSIKESLHHIGILRAMGISGKEVGNIFLIEAMILTVSGGIIGIPGGIAASQIVGRLSGVNPSYGIWQVVVTLVIAVGMGAAAGYYPALKAAKMEPIDAIRG